MTIAQLGHWTSDQEAGKILMELCQADLRCLDAHSHLGNLVFDRRPEDAIRHYEVGLRIFDRMLLLNPSDNQGVRFLIEDVRAKRTWEESCEPKRT